MTDVARVHLLASKSIQGCYMAHECGLGKTMMYAGVKLHEQRHLEHRLANKEKVLFKPCVIMVPAGLAMPTFKKLRWFLTGEFVMYLYYGDPKSTEALDLRNDMIDTDQLLDIFQAKDEVKRKQEQAKPENGRIIVVTSYTTFGKRAVQRKTRELRSLTEQQRESLGLNDMDHEKYDDRNLRKKTDKLNDLELAAAVGKPYSDGTNCDINVYQFKYKLECGILVTDEAHMIRSHATRSHQCAALFDCEKKIMASATPMVNHVRDLLGTLRLLAPHLSMQMRLPDDFDPVQLYKPDIDPLAPTGSYEWVDMDGDRRDPLDVQQRGDPLIECVANDEEFAGTQATHSQFFKDRLREWEEDRFPWWIFNAALFKEVGRKHKWTFDACRVAINRIIEELFVRRTLSTRLKMPDGSFTTPGDGMPKVTVKTAEMTMPDPMLSCQRIVMEAFWPSLFSPPGKEKTDRKKMPKDPEDVNVRMNYGVWRAMQMGVVDAANVTMLELLDGMTQEHQDAWREAEQALNSDPHFGHDARNMDALNQLSNHLRCGGDLDGFMEGCHDPEGDEEELGIYDRDDDADDDRDDDDRDDRDDDAADDEGGDQQDGEQQNVASQADPTAGDDRAVDGGDDDPEAVPLDIKPVKSEAKLGTNEVRAYRGMRDMGLFTVFNKLCRDHRIAPPTNNYDMILFLTSTSPVLAWALRRTIEIITAEGDESGLPNRVVISIEYPWLQQ
jgi:hypothetical protein